MKIQISLSSAVGESLSATKLDVKKAKAQVAKWKELNLKERKHPDFRASKLRRTRVVSRKEKIKELETKIKHAVKGTTPRKKVVRHKIFPDLKSEKAYHAAMDEAKKTAAKKQGSHADKAKASFDTMKKGEQKEIVRLIKKAQKAPAAESKQHIREIRSKLGVKSLGANPYATLNRIHLIGT